MRDTRTNNISHRITPLTSITTNPVFDLDQTVSESDILIGGNLISYFLGEGGLFNPVLLNKAVSRIKPVVF